VNITQNISFLINVFFKEQEIIFILKRKITTMQNLVARKTHDGTFVYNFPPPLLELISSTYGSSLPFDSCNESQYLEKNSRMNCITNWPSSKKWTKALKESLGYVSQLGSNNLRKQKV